jgi:hypothetical protein
MSIYVKKYSTDLDLSANGRPTSWYYGGDSYNYNERYNNLSADCQTYCIVPRIGSGPVTWIKWDSVVNLNMEGQWFTAFIVSGGARIYFGSSPTTYMWGYQNDWEPLNYTNFKNKCITFINTNRPSGWDNINLDIWTFQNLSNVANPSQHLDQLFHFPVFFEGNNPQADEVI